EREFLDRDLGAERCRFSRQPGGAGPAADRRGAVDALPVPRGEPARRAGLRLGKIRERCRMHRGSIGVGWVERSETHHRGVTKMGFAALNPSYDHQGEGAMAEPLKRRYVK